MLTERKSMKAIRKKLAQVEKAILSDELTKDEYDAYTAELKTLKELIATKKAMASYEEDYGEADDEASNSKNKRVSNQEWV